MPDEIKFVCLCTVCRNDIVKGDKLADHAVYKCGELNYIELAHEECAIRDNAIKATRDPKPYWEIGVAQWGESAWIMWANQTSPTSHKSQFSWLSPH